MRTSGNRYEIFVQYVRTDQITYEFGGCTYVCMVCKCTYVCVYVHVCNVCVCVRTYVRIRMLIF